MPAHHAPPCYMLPVACGRARDHGSVNIEVAMIITHRTGIARRRSTGGAPGFPATIVASARPPESVAVHGGKNSTTRLGKRAISNYYAVVILI